MFTSESFGTRHMNFVIRHPPRATVARSQVGTALVFAEPFDKVIALADVKAAGANALEDVDEVHVKKWSGRLDLNQRPPAPKAGALIQAELRPEPEPQYKTKRNPRQPPV